MSRTSAERKQAIHDLVVEELREEHDVDASTVISHWMVLVRIQFFDDDPNGPGDVGNVEVVHSDPAPSGPDEMGLLGWRTAQAYAAVALEMKARDEEGDDEP